MLPGDGVDLSIHPPTSNRSLRAWDAADELLLRHVLADGGSRSGRVLVVNDDHGALALTLRANGWTDSIVSWSDSWSSHRSLEVNARRNGIDMGAGGGPPIECLPSTEAPTGSWSLVCIRVPKSLAMLADQLGVLRPFLDADTLLVGAGMVKHVHTSTLALFDDIIGPTSTSLATKKARLIHPVLGSEGEIEPSGRVRDRTEENGIQLREFAGVFARGRLDIGTRFLLEHLPAVPVGADVIDLGCGNGILGLTIARDAKCRSVSFCDVSHHAVASARASWAANPELSASSTEVSFEVGDGLAAVPSDSVDLIVNNPPFHEGQRVSDDTVWRMFTEARRTLQPGGEIRVVANRHLGHHAKLANIFGHCQTVAANRKFVVLSAVR